MMRRLLPLLLGLGVVVGLALSLDLDWAALFHGDLNAGTSALRAAAERQGPLKDAVLTLMIGLLPLLVVPISLLMLTAAMMLAPFKAVLVMLLGTALASSLSFALGRLAGRRVIEWLGWERFKLLQAVRGGAERHGFKMMLFARCLPVPFAFPGLAAGMLGLRFVHVFWGTCAMMLPWSLVYVFFGEALKRGDARYLGPALALFAVLSLLAWKVRKRGAPEGGLPAGLLSPQAPALGPELRLYTLPGHDASEEARAELWRLRPRFGFEVRETDLAQDPALMAQFQDMAPVVFLGERRLFSFQVDENALELFLKEKA
jgi:uncharacterized membrane protein YdjX (TVP38/TMEM64 family)